MSLDIQIVELPRTPKEVMRFLNVSYGIYEGDPHWVAPLLSDLKRVFTDENPLFHHAEMKLWVATRDGKDAGRIAGLYDPRYQSTEKKNTAFWGFYESEDDPAVTKALFSVFSAWARARKLDHAIGPMNPTTNDECGLLVEGFDSPPVFMMPYNPQYYVNLVEAAGYRKAKDLLAYHIDLSILPMDRLKRIAAKVRQRNSDLTFRPILRKNLDRDIAKVKEVYNVAWEDNWGFIPMTDAEVDFMAKRLKPMLMEGLVWLAEAGSTPVAFLLATPDYNIALKPLKGRLLSLKTLGFIPYLLGWKVPPRTRVLTLGVIDKYRGKGLESALLIEGLRVGMEAGVTESEASWILEDNVMMRRVLESIGSKPYKTYRLYEGTLS